MATHISPLSQVDPRAELAEDVTIGPFCVVGPDVRIGPGTHLKNHVTIVGHTTIGADNVFFPNCVIGEEPQDISYTGSPTRTIIGDRNGFREGVTVHRGSEKEDGVTRIGNNCLFMATSHVAHNCWIHDHVIVANGTQLGGHVHIHDRATISGNCVIHHFDTIGTLAFVGGAARVTRDVPPYMMAIGSDDFHIHSVNVVGMQRQNHSPAVIQLVRRIHRMLYRELKNVTVAREIFLNELGDPLPRELECVFDFVTEQDLGKNGRARERCRDPEQRRAA